MTIIGFAHTEFEKNGFKCSGVNFYVTEERKNVTGVACDKVYVSDKLLAESGVKLSEISVGDTLRVFYNKYGRVESLLVE